MTVKLPHSVLFIFLMLLLLLLFLLLNLLLPGNSRGWKEFLS